MRSGIVAAIFNLRNVRPVRGSGSILDRELHDGSYTSLIRASTTGPDLRNNSWFRTVDRTGASKPPGMPLDQRPRFPFF